MLAELIKIRFKRYFNFRDARSGNKAKKLIGFLVAVLFIYVAGVFMMMFGGMFGFLASLLIGSDDEWLYFTMIVILSFCLLLIIDVMLVYGEIYKAKDNELLMSLPIKSTDIVLSRLFVILMMSYLYEAVIFLPAFFVYHGFAVLPVFGYLAFVLEYLTVPLPAIALALIAAYGIALLNRVAGRFKNVIGAVFFIAVMGFYIRLTIKLGESIEYILAFGIGLIRDSVEVFPLLAIIGKAVSEGNIIDLLISLALCIIPFFVVFKILDRNFIRLATTKDRISRSGFRFGKVKSNHLMIAMIKREIRHYCGNFMVMMNAMSGILVEILLIVYLIIDHDDLNILNTIGIPLMPVAVIAIGSMSSFNIISSVSISLEGRSIGIIKSLPLSEKAILFAKVLTHIVVSAPFSIVTSIVVSVVFGFDIIESLIVIFVPLIFVIFSALYGLVINLSRPRLDYLSDVALIKRSFSSTVTLFSLLAIYIFISLLYASVYDLVDPLIYIIIISLFFIFIDVMLIRFLSTWGVKRFNSIY